MYCEDFIPLISGRLDGCNSEMEEKALQEHLRHCAQCRDLLTQMEQNDQLLSHMVEPPADLSARIMDAVRREPRKSGRKRWYASFTAAGLATAALLALVFFGSTGLPAMKTDDAAIEMAYEAPADTGTEDALCRAEDSPQTEYLSDAYADYGQTTGGSAGNYYVAPSLEPGEQDDPIYEDQESSKLYAAESSGQPFTNDMPMRKGAADAYGLLSTDGTVQEIPTLIIQEADISNFPGLKYLPMDTEAQTMPAASDSEASFYERFLSSLPTERYLLGSGTLRTVSYFSLSRYSLPYDSFAALLEAVAGKYELSVYLPADMTEVETCLVIFIHSEE